MFKLNQKGMTLVETMVAAGLLGGLAVAGMTLFKTQNKAQQTVEQNYEMTATLSAIRGILADLDGCQQTLGGRLPNGATVPAIIKVVSGVNTTAYTSSTTARLPGTPLKLTSMRTNNTIPGLASNETMLQLFFSRGENAQTTTQVAKNVRINYTLSGANIGSCYAVTGGASDSLWQIQGTGPNIYYASGNVGIGTSTPNRELHVVGNDQIFMLEGTNHVYQGFYPRGFAAGRKAWIGYGASGTTDLSITNEDTGHLRLHPVTGDVVINRGAIQLLSATATQSNGIGINPNGDQFNYTNSSGTWKVPSYGLSTAPYPSAAATYLSGWGELGLFTGGANRLHITNSGSVGIGVTAPITKVEVNGSITSKGGDLILQRPVTGGGWARGVHYTPDGSVDVTTSGIAGIGLLGSGTTASRLYMTFGSSPWVSSTGIQVTSAGNVGIGTINPSTLLEVNTTQSGTSNDGIRINNPTSGWGSSLTFGVGNNGGYNSAQITSTNDNTTDSTGGLLQFKTAQQSSNVLTTRMTILDNGNVGIGTATPRFQHEFTGKIINTAAYNANINLGSYDLGVGSVGAETVYGYGAICTGNTTGSCSGTGGVVMGTTNAGAAVNLRNDGVIRASSYLYTSDARAKKSIHSIENALDQVTKLRGVRFTWKDSDRDDIGFIAQEVKKVEPDLVEDSEALMSVKYGNISALLVEAIKEIKSMLDTLIGTDKALKEEIESLKGENSLLKSRLDAQELRMKRQDKILSELQMRSRK